MNRGGEYVYPYFKTTNVPIFTDSGWIPVEPETGVLHPFFWTKNGYDAFYKIDSEAVKQRVYDASSFLPYIPLIFHRDLVKKMYGFFANLLFRDVIVSNLYHCREESQTWLDNLKKLTD
jgi:hypothetical protein